LAVAALAVLSLAGAATQVAWACVPQPLVYLEPMSSGPAGSQVTVTAASINGDAEVRWNGAEGPQLAKASGPHFSAPVTVPADAGPGMYAVIVLTRAPGGAVTGSGRAAFLVTGPGGATAGAGGGASGQPKAQAKQVSRSTKGVSGAGLVLGVLGVLAVGLVIGGVIGRQQKRAPAALAGS